MKFDEGLDGNFRGLEIEVIYLDCGDWNKD